jgi:thiosulfate/3-mercaptopyruvate sulfurtransferase
MHRGFLVSSEWLHLHCRDQAVRIVDLRSRPGDPAWGEREYARAHIPGAVYLWSRGKALPADRYRRIMEEIGVSDDTLVIAYDDSMPPRAARLVWSLHYYGHTAACMLDGGFRKWVAERRPVEAGFCVPPRGHLSIRIDSALRVAKDDVARILAARSARLVDCRTDRSWSEAGAHIPGATHLPASTFFRETDGTWRPDDDLRRLAGAAGVPLDTRLVLYCSAGVSASCGYLMLKSLGAEHVSVYDASWNEWGRDSATPKESH